MTRWRSDQLAALQGRLREQIARPLEVRGEEIVDRRRAKYRNMPTDWQGQRFDSKRECEKYKEFKLQEIAGQIRAVIRQVSMPLPGTTHRIRVDFLIVNNDGTNTWYDAKGFETPQWRGKRKQVFDAYGITINLI